MPTAPTNANANHGIISTRKQRSLHLIAHIIRKRRDNPPTDSPEEAEKENWSSPPAIDLPKPIAPIFAAAPAAKMLPYSWAKQERRGGWSLSSCAAVSRAEWRETLARDRPIYRGIAPMPS